MYGSNNELREVRPSTPLRMTDLGSITISEYQWNRPTTMRYPGGSTRKYEYDALMRLKHLIAKDPGGNVLLDYQYEYDSTGNIVSKTTEHGTYSYGYDGASRLTSVDNPTVDDESYSYDVVGNRTSASNANGSIAHNANNELTVYGEIEYEYDDNGNMTEVTLSGQVMFTYHYNADNRLVKAEGGNSNTIAKYSYDPFGRRLWKEVSGVRTYFFYSDEGLIGEYDASGTEIRTYGYKPNSTWMTDPLWLKQGNEYYFYQNDHLGTPQKLVAQNGAVMWLARYSAFGQATVDVSGITNNLRFPGQYVDAETGLHYNWNRYYDSVTGRYLRTDPLRWTRGNLNFYEYTENNPINAIDPYGLFKREQISEKMPNGENRVSYSCKCGWIDRGHLQDSWRMWRDISEAIDHYETLYPLTNYGVYPFKVAQPGDATFILAGFRFLYDGRHKKEGKERLDLAFDIFFDTYTAFEKHQGRIMAGGPYTASSLAVDDLPSNFLGFMEAAGQISWEKLCEPLLDEQKTLDFFDDGELYNEHVFAGVRPGPILPLTAENHHPRLWENEEFRNFLKSQGTCHPCEGKDITIPSIFGDYSPGTCSRDYRLILIDENFPYIENLLERIIH